MAARRRATHRPASLHAGHELLPIVQSFAGLGVVDGRLWLLGSRPSTAAGSTADSTKSPPSTVSLWCTQVCCARCVKKKHQSERSGALLANGTLGCSLLY